MNAIARAAQFETGFTPAGPIVTAYPDPLDEDAATDGPVATTRRALVRLALVAAETGARFQRDGVEHDAMAWLLAPRRLFDGGAAVEACLERRSCLRAVLLHGVGLGLDADPADIDDLLSDEGDDAARLPSGNDRDDHGGGGTHPQRGRLYTATVSERTGRGIVHSFDAAVLASEEHMRARLRDRLGAEAAASATVVEGFRGSALTEALVTESMEHVLRLVASDPVSPLARGLDVVLQQRFAE